MAYLNKENKRKQRQRNSFTGFSYSYGYPGLPDDERMELEGISAEAYRKREKAEKYSSGAETYEKRIPDSACRHLKLHDIMKFMSDGRAYDELSHRE